jgi:SP family myo-inositol transporter-like MFS transporter 13
VIFCFPEVRGMPLENVREVFHHGFGVGYARQWQKENKAFAKVNAGNSQAFGH